ncbi:MAG: GNAT family N-acetyltransferase [Pseudomonadota bacterium]
MSEAISISITRSESGSKGRYEATVKGHDGHGELTFSRMSAEKIIADHTGVDDSLRGLGVGKALVERLIADARKDGFSIVPLCTFVRAQYRKHPEWVDVMDS